MKLVNKTGYLKGAKTAKNPVNIIPSNLITTQGMAFPIKANGKTLYPNTGQYKFPTSPVVETPLKKRFQEGVNKLEGDLISKVVMNRNKDKDFVQRAYAVGKNPKSLMFTRIGNPEEPPYQTKETHRMGWGEDDKGQTYMFPTIMNPNNEAIKVPNQYADYISKEGYKKATGMSYQKGTKNAKTFNFTPNTSLAGDNTVNTQGREDAKADKFSIQKTKDFNAAQAAGAMAGDKGAEDKFYSRYGEGSNKFRYDTDPNYAAQMDKNLKAAKKAGKPILKETVKLDPNAMFMLPTGLKGQAAKDYQDFHKEIIGSALPIPGVPKGLRQGKNISKQIPVSNSKSFNLKNLFNSKSSNNKTQSGLDWMKNWYSDSDFARRYSPTGQHPAIKMQPEILNRLNQYQPKNYIDLYKDKGLKNYLNYSLTSEGLSYGTPKNIYLNRTFHPFNKKGLESTRAHELTHLIERNGMTLSKADEQALLKPFGISNTSEIPKTPGFFEKEILGNNPEYYLDPTEIHARMNEARYGLGLSPKDKFTEEMFDKISKKNSWGGMGRYIKDKKGFIDLMNNFWAAPPAAIVGAGAMQEKKNGVKTLKYKNGTKGVSLAFSRGEKDPKGGLTQKGVDKYNRATGGNLKMAVTTPPSKIKAGSKDANRRASFCSRMSGVKGPMEKNGKPTRKALALRKWNC